MRPAVCSRPPPPRGQCGKAGALPAEVHFQVDDVLALPRIGAPLRHREGGAEGSGGHGLVGPGPGAVGGRAAQRGVAMGAAALVHPAMSRGCTCNYMLI